MKKRPFILVELLICIAILSICAIPLLGYPYYSYKKQRDLLLSIEKQRQAEILFYDLLKNFDVSWEKISFEYTNKKDLDPLTINIKGLGPTTLYPHYHLYVHPKAKETKTKKGIAKLWCCFCMEETKDTCTMSWADHTPYTFNLFAKKVEEKEANASKEN